MVNYRKLILFTILFLSCIEMKNENVIFILQDENTSEFVDAVMEIEEGGHYFVDSTRTIKVPRKVLKVNDKIYLFNSEYQEPLVKITKEMITKDTVMIVMSPQKIPFKPTQYRGHDKNEIVFKSKIYSREKNKNKYGRIEKYSLNKEYVDITVQYADPSETLSIALYGYKEYYMLLDSLISLLPSGKYYGNLAGSAGPSKLNMNGVFLSRHRSIECNQINAISIKNKKTKIFSLIYGIKDSLYHASGMFRPIMKSTIRGETFKIPVEK